jgi:hypothetical protein
LDVVIRTVDLSVTANVYDFYEMGELHPLSSGIDAKVHLFTQQRLVIDKKLAKVQAFSFF